MGWGIKWERGAPRALRLRLAMHLFVKYNPKSVFTFGMKVSHLCLHRFLWLCSALIEGYSRADHVFFSSINTISSEFVHDIVWVLMSVHALHDSQTEAPLAIVHQIRLNSRANDSAGAS
jgi:hypothetical protein